MNPRAVSLVKYVAIPITLIVVLAVCLPFEKMLIVPWIFEYGVTNPTSVVASSLIAAYAVVVLLYTYVLLGRVPTVMAPVLALLTGLFASDYYELPRFVLIYPMAFVEQVSGGMRPAVSVLWSSSLFHLLCGVVVFVLLKIKWSKGNIFMFLVAPWVFYVVKLVYPLKATTVSLGFLGVVTGGVAVDLPNRMLCWAVLLYLLSGSEWRGLKPLTGFVTGLARVIRSGEVLGYVKWSLRYIPRGDWALGSEMAFWEYDLEKRWLPGEIKTAPYDMAPVIEILRGRFGEALRVIEIGPGPRSRLTLEYRSGDIGLVSVDPLADDYVRWLGGEGFLRQGFAEDLDKMFAPESFHMGYASNVLDHTRDPTRCLRNMVRLVKPGGLIVVQSNDREGSRLGWQGLHRFDIWLEGERLLCETREGAVLNLTEGLGLVKVDELRVLFSEIPWFTVVYEVSPRR